MENLPESPFEDTTLTSSPLLCNTSSYPSSSMVIQQIPLHDLASTISRLWRSEIQFGQSPVPRKRETCHDLAPLLWDTFSAVWILLQEVIAVYRKLSPSKLSMRESTRACNALALFQVLAINPETRRKLIEAEIPPYFYPFLKRGGDDKPLEYLRRTSLGVLGSLARFDEPYGPEVLHFLMESKVVPYCLECMDLCDELSAKVATLIVMKILMQEEGMTYCCASAERFYSIVQVLYRVVEKLAEKLCLLHLKYVIQCYLSLSEVSRFVWPCDALRSQVPPQLFDNTFNDILHDDLETSWALQLLHANIFGYRYFPMNQDSNSIPKPDTTTQKVKEKGKKK
ncbi:hypothetical protein K7X08_028067 [Anisodus acutangulus]|uniref:Cell differentiation protein rcd1 n=1 Tax=Anisodus acutangulus TaxID=402998 RepID=A0A9Q1MV41_9SOLA|nr:hypothetical protein K7X08_028067 [Anisodus acutangulus]